MQPTGHDTAAAHEERLFSGYTGRLFWVTAVGAMVAVLGQFVFPLLLPSITAEFGLSSARAGFIVTLIWLCSGLARYPGGHFSDHLTRKTVLLVAMLFGLTGLTVFFLALGYWMLLVGAIILGLGLGLYFPTAISQISDLFVEKRGQAMGFHIGVINLGGAVASGLVVLVLAVAPWRSTFLPLIGILAVLTVLLHVWSREAYAFDVSALRIDFIPTAARLLRQPGVIYVVIIVTIFNIMFQGYLNFLPTYLQDVKSLSPVTSSVIFALFFVGGAVSNPVAGRIGDRFQHPPIAAVSSVLAIVGLAITVGTDSVVGLTLGVLVVAAGGTAMWPVMTAFIMDQVPEASKGGDLGAVSAIYFTVGSVGPTYVGWIATRWDLSVAYLSLTPALLVTLVLASWLTLNF